MQTYFFTILGFLRSFASRYFFCAGQLAIIIVFTTFGLTYGQSSGCLSPFNLVSFDDVAVQHSDIQGKVLVCGNMTVSNYTVGAQLPVGTTDTVLFVSGNYSHTNGAVQGGRIVAGGSVSLNSVTNQMGNFLAPPPPVSQNVSSFPINCHQLQSYYQDVSGYYGNSTANGVFSTNGANEVFNCLGQSGTVVFNINLSLFPDIFNNGGEFQLINHTNATSIIINIIGSNVFITAHGYNLAFQDNSNKIVWNFLDATQLTMTALGHKGSVLAPYALLSMEEGHVDGNVIVNGYQGGSLGLPNGGQNAGQFHSCKNETDCSYNTYYTGMTGPFGCAAHYFNKTNYNWSFSCLQNTDVDVYGVGPLDTWNGSAVVSVPGSGNVQKVIAEISYRDQHSACHPSSVTFTTNLGQSLVVYPYNIGGDIYMYRTEIVGAIGGVTVTGDIDCKPVSINVYAFRTMPNTTGAVGVFIDGFYNSNQQLINIPFLSVLSLVIYASRFL